MSGKGLIEVLEELKPDALIMDMLLSGSDGIEICREMKDTELVKNIPLTLFTAHPNAKDSCLESGADYFIEKPFNMHSFLQLLDELW